MLIYSNEQIKKADLFTIENEPISSIDLMERASSKCVEYILNNFEKDLEFLIFCGPGNNGGDGLAIARLLHFQNIKVRVFLLGEKFSSDNLMNQTRLKELNIPIEKFENNSIQPNQIIIDALFGTGISKPILNFYKNCIDKINESSNFVISIDLPSGIRENGFEISEPIIKANLTLTFQFPKLVFVFPELGNFIGDFIILDIGLHPDALKNEKPFGHFLSREMISPILKIREKFSHKGKFGHACLIGGEYGKIGAMELATKACMRTGAGLTTVVIPKCGYEIMQISNPEAMVVTSNGDNFHDDLKLDFNLFTAIGIGPGMGQAKETANVLKYIIQNANSPLVLDADALNILSENKTWLAFLPPLSILTPHPGEFKRLVGDWKNNLEKFELQKDFALKNNCVLILKGAYTSIASPAGNLYFNSTGNNGLAKGGSGDTLTGMITSLLAQRYTSLEASLLGVYLHGLAADLAIEKISEESLLATDVIESISTALQLLKD